MRSLFLLLFPFFSFAQTMLRGTVVDARTGAAIPYVTIGLKKENVGTSADENGAFRLTAKPLEGDTLLLSSVGYTPLRIATASLSEEQVFKLSPKETTLRNVVVSNRAGANQATVGALSGCGNVGRISSGFQTQLAQPLVAPVSGARLASVSICSSGGFFSKESSIFRLRIYDRDSLTGRPGADLCDEAIEVRMNRKKINIDLLPYAIYLPQKNFFVAVEWLFIPYNYNETEYKQNGMKKKWGGYYPAIGTSRAGTTETSLWSLNFQNIWLPSNIVNEQAAITATVTY